MRSAGGSDLYPQFIASLRALTGLVVKLTFFSCCFAALSRARTGAAGQSADEANLRSLVERFFAVCQKQDQQGRDSLWSMPAPNLSESRKSLEQDFPAG